ncbi:hypothetical protein GOP47_0000259 [Adiantum capillus-veneris]|uniref:Uncharacterized protein n=1 Tax=Adiantum capillus-veneris TaxID=13818 RepID=A0A9D4VCP8_ADICA|nr:hypothetical protein GOP47_0000259 [Adiantum capillus-veneris]
MAFNASISISLVRRSSPIAGPRKKLRSLLQWPSISARLPYALQGVPSSRRCRASPPCSPSYSIMRLFVLLRRDAMVGFRRWGGSREKQDLSSSLWLTGAGGKEDGKDREEAQSMRDRMIPQDPKVIG